METKKYRMTFITVSLIILYACSTEHSPISKTELTDKNIPEKIKITYPEEVKIGSKFSLSVGINQPDPMYCMSSACISDIIDSDGIIKSSNLIIKILGGEQPGKTQSKYSGTGSLSAQQKIIEMKMPLFSPSEIQNTFYYNTLLITSEEGQLLTHDFKIKVKYKN